MKFRHTKKLKALNASDPFDEFSVKNTVINLSNITLTKDQNEALSLGLNMSWPNFKFDEIRLQSELEAKYNIISKKVANTNEIHTTLKHSFLELFQTCKKSIKHFRPPQKVLNLYRSLKDLSKYDNIYINRFDKGNGVVIDNVDHYSLQMHKILDDESKFKYIGSSNDVKNFDFFIKREESFNRSLYNLKTKKEISDEFYKKVRNTGGQTPKMYGLAKIHKDKTNPPYRPILSMINSFKSNLAKSLDQILKPFVPEKYMFKDTFDFINRMKCFKTNSDAVHISFDAKSLSTVQLITFAILFHLIKFLLQERLSQNFLNWPVVMFLFYFRKEYTNNLTAWQWEVTLLLLLPISQWT